LTSEFVPLYRTVISSDVTTAQATLVFSTVFGATLNYDAVFIHTCVEEDGELKILHTMDAGNPEQRKALFAGTTKAMAERSSAAAW
jgi:hypothetical protein